MLVWPHKIVEETKLSQRALQRLKARDFPLVELLYDSALGVVTKDNLINWSGVVGADLEIDLGFASTSASGETGLHAFTKGTSLAPYSGNVQSGFNPRPNK